MLHCNDVSHWLGASLKSSLCLAHCIRLQNYMRRINIYFGYLWAVTQAHNTVSHMLLIMLSKRPIAFRNRHEHVWYDRPSVPVNDCGNSCINRIRINPHTTTFSLPAALVNQQQWDVWFDTRFFHKLGAAQLCMVHNMTLRVCSTYATVMGLIDQSMWHIHIYIYIYLHIYIYICIYIYWYRFHPFYLSFSPGCDLTARECFDGPAAIYILYKLRSVQNLYYICILYKLISVQNTRTCYPGQGWFVRNRPKPRCTWQIQPRPG